MERVIVLKYVFRDIDFFRTMTLSFDLTDFKKIRIRFENICQLTSLHLSRCAKLRDDVTCTTNNLFK